MTDLQIPPFVRYLLYTVIAAAIGGVIVSSPLPSFQDRRDAYFKAALAAADTSIVVHIDGRTFDVARGDIMARDGRSISSAEYSRALRLAFGLTTTRTDPLLSLEGTDTKVLRRAIQALELARDEVAERQTNQASRDRISHDLFPIDFLYALAELEESRQKALASGTEQTFAAYMIKLEQTLWLGARDLGRFKRNYDAAVEGPYERLMLLAGTVTKTHTLDTLTALERAFVNARREQRERIACLRGNIAVCRPMPVPALPPMPKAMIRDETTLTGVQDIYAKASPSKSGTSTVIALRESGCLSPLGPTTYIEQLDISNSEFTAYTYVGDIVLRRLDADLGDSLNWYKSHMSTYIPHNPFVYYTCPRAGEDIAHARAVSDIAKLLSMNNDIVWYEDTVLQRALIEIEGRGMMGQNMELRDALSAYRDRSSGLEDGVYDVVRSVRALSALSQHGVPTDLSPAFLFATHSGYYTLFMAHNRSLVASTLSPFASDASAEYWKTHVLFSTMSGEDPDQIAHDIGIYLSVHKQ